MTRVTISRNDCNERGVPNGIAMPPVSVLFLPVWEVGDGLEKTTLIARRSRTGMPSRACGREFRYFGRFEQHLGFVSGPTDSMQASAVGWGTKRSEYVRQ